VSYNIGRFLNQFIDYPSQDKNRKYEVLNKNFLLSKNAKFDFLENISVFLANILEKESTDAALFMSKNVLQIERILQLFENLIFTKKETTMDKDLQKTVNLLKSPLYFQILAKISLSKEPELVYRATVIMNVVIVCLNDKQRVREYQGQILNYSTLLLKHVEFCMSECSGNQKHASILFICNCLFDNISACNLMMRLIPKPLFNLVEENLGDISKWALSQWELLFKNLNNDFNSATQQWNQESRDELRAILKTATETFYRNYKPISKIQTKAFIMDIFKAPDFVISKEQEEKIIQLKWNYEEYEVKHNSLKKKLPVYKYYIEEIIIDKPNPELTVKEFKRPKKFWDELTTALIAGNNTENKEKYLKCMILLYREKNKHIKYSNVIPFVLKQISESIHPSLSYLYIQLLYTFIENDPQNHNVRRFLDANGLQVILNHIRQNFFKEDLNQIDYNELESLHRAQLENANHSSSGRNSEQSSKADENSIANLVVYLFCKSSLNREALIPEYRKSNEIIICINIFKSCIMRTKSQTEESLLLFPMPMARLIAFQQSTIDLFQNLLMLKDDTLLNHTLDFIVTTYLDKFNFVHFIRNKWVFPILLSKINDVNKDKISGFFESVLESHYKVSTDATKAMLEDLKNLNINSPINSLVWYRKDGTNLIKQDPLISKIFDDFPGFYYLPPYFWHTLLSRGRNAFVSLLFNTKFDSAFLNWTSAALSKLKQSLLDIVKPIDEQGYDKVPFEPRAIHYSFADELVIGPIILKNWVFNSNAQSVITLENTSKFMKSITDQLKSILDSLKEEKHRKLDFLKHFLLLTEALSILSKNLTIIPHNEFGIICAFMRYYLFCEQLNFRNVTRIEHNYLDYCLINCFKVIKNSMKTETSQDELIDFLAFSELKRLILEIMQRCIRSTLNDFASPTYHQLQINYVFLKILKKIFQNNGYLFVSFKDETPATEKFLDVNHILANLNIMLVKNFIGLFTKSDKLRRTSTDEGVRFDVEVSQMLTSPFDPIDKPANTKSSVFRRKMTFDKHQIVEIHNDDNDKFLANANPQNINDISFNPSISEKLLDEGRNSHTDIHDGTLEALHADLSLQEINDCDDKLKDAYNILIEDTPHDSFKVAHKKLDFHQLKSLISHFDLSVTPISEILKDIKQEVGDKLLQPGYKGSSFFHALKRLLQNFFLMWISLVHNLSQNRRNTIALIESGIPLICFRITTIHPNSHLSSSSPLIHDINRFCASALQIFKNILYFCAEAVYHFDQNWRETLNQSLDKKALRSLEDNSFLNAHKNLTFIQNYFIALSNFFTMPIIALIMNNPNNEDLMQILNSEVEDLYYILNDSIISEINKTIKQYLAESIRHRNFTEFDRLANAKIFERSKHISINDIYIESYIKNPKAIDNAQLIINGAFPLLESLKRVNHNFQILLEFMIKFEKTNRETIAISSDQYMILMSVFTFPNIQCKIALLSFLKARLKVRPSEFDPLLDQRLFYKTMIDFYLLYIRISHGKFASMDATNFKNDSEIQTLLEVNNGIIFVGKVLDKFVSFVSKLAIAFNLPYFQELFIDIIMSAEHNKIYLAATKALLSIEKFKPNVQSFIDSLMETKKNLSPSVELLAEILNKNEIIHPLMCFTFKQKLKLSDQIIAYLKTVSQKLSQTDGLQIFSEPSINTTDLLRIDIKPSYYYNRINMVVFLNSKDNSFIFNREFSNIIERVSEQFETYAKTDEEFKVFSSVILILLTNEQFNSSAVNWINVYLTYTNNQSLQSEYNQILLTQLLAHVPLDILQSNFSLKLFFGEKLKHLVTLTTGQEKLSDIIFLQALMRILLRGTYPLSSQISDIEFAQNLLAIKSNLQENRLITQLINHILALCLMTNALTSPAIKYIKDAEIQQYLDILSLDYKLFIKNFTRTDQVDTIAYSQTIEYWEKNFAKSKNLPNLPIVYKPEMILP